MKMVFPTLIPTHPHSSDRSFATGSIPLPPFASRLAENTLASAAAPLRYAQSVAVLVNSNGRLAGLSIFLLTVSLCPRAT